MLLNVNLNGVVGRGLAGNEDRKDALLVLGADGGSIRIGRKLPITSKRTIAN